MVGNDSFIPEMIHLFLKNDSFISGNDSFIYEKMIHLFWKMVWGPVPNSGKWFSCSYRSIRAPEKWSGEMVPEMIHSFWKMIHLFMEND